jgi:hypothetical protein
MSDNDRFIGVLEDYLDAFDGETPLPDRVRDAVRAELPSARQVQPRPGPLRVFTMLSTASAGARAGLAAATIVAAVVLGAAVLNNDRSPGIVGAVPTSTPTATSAPSPAPTNAATPAPSAALPIMLGNAPTAACGAIDPTVSGCLAAGTYRLTGGPDEWPVVVRFDVPAGWFEWQAETGFDGVLVDSGPNGGSGWGVMFTTVGDVARDPCDGTKGVIPAAQADTPQELAAAMAAWPGFTATAPQPITVDGHDGLRLQLTLAARNTCTNNPSAWLTSAGSGVDLYPMISSGATAPGTYEIVDTGHGLLVIRTTDFPQTSPEELAGRLAANPTRHAADQAALHAILDSIRLGEWSPGPSAPTG